MAPAGADLEFVRLASEALGEARDLINTPANDLGPAELGEAVQRLALQHEAECRIIVGEDLLRQNYPLIYEVGKGSAREPRLIDLRWGKRGAPQVTLVGKGVCFDTGGLDIKPSSGMLLMKKDMGGAALTLALARMLMDADAPVQLRLLIPAVENSISGRSYRPSDVLRSRQGLTVEIGNTDAEGRLVLADALTEADREEPELLIDLATLTGRGARRARPRAARYLLDAPRAGRAIATGRRERGGSGVDRCRCGPATTKTSAAASPTLIMCRPRSSRAPSSARCSSSASSRARATGCTATCMPGIPRSGPGRPVGADPHTVRALYRLIRQRFG